MKGEVFDDVVLKMSSEDNVVTALDHLSDGSRFAYDGDAIDVREDVPFGHKVALVELVPGDEIVKYGETIGSATDPISPGEWVHTHNCESTRGRGDVAARGGSV